LITAVSRWDYRQAGKVTAWHHLLMQLCAYTAVLRLNGRQIDSIGIINFYQKDIRIVDMSSWDHGKFLEELVNRSCRNYRIDSDN